MAGPNRHKRFTVYDAMEAKGLFESNPANPDSRGPEGESLYRGPVAYPKMFYHPTGDERVTNPGEEVVSPLRGPMLVGRQVEMIHQVAHNSEDEARLRAEGWHDHPAKALRAAGKAAPAMGSGQRIQDLEAEIKRLQAQQIQMAQPPADLTGGTPVPESGKLGKRLGA